MRIADLHIHSRFSRATSKEGDTVHLDHWARRKGIHLVGTGDFTHPAWRQELAETLQPAEEGLYTLRPTLALPGSPGGEAPRFVITGEISSIYKRGGKTRKVHNLILLPSLEAAEALSHKLEAIGNIHSDGRPILGLDSRDLLEITLETCPGAVFIPAHIWTPHFALFGAFSGFDAIEECFGDLTPYIHALETGLSSDPPMNWRVSALDRFNLVSNSDAHSPNKLGREANLLDIDLSYPALARALEGGAAQGFRGTIEFFPEEGKYHFDGHRNCGQCLSPEEAEAVGGICPVCGKKLTVGVDHRVHQLADRPLGAKKENALPFESLAPLPEAIGASTGLPAGGVKVARLYEEMLRQLGPEFYILRQAPLEDIGRVAGPCVQEGIRRLRAGQVQRRPGFDGEYGVIQLLTEAEIDALSGQVTLFGAAAPTAPKAKRAAAKAKPAAPQAEGIGPAGEELNPAQRRAVESQAPAIAVVAGPGTGKTKTLVARICRLVEQGAKPQQITAVTFTNKAAEEMRQRLAAALGDPRAAKGMHIGTFHALCLQRLGDAPPLIDPYQARDLAAQVLRQAGEKCSPRKLLEQVSRRKNRVSQGIEPGLEEACALYEKRLREQGLMDLDDLLLQALEADGERTVGARNPFAHLLVDEFQDCNAIQYQLVQAWSRGGKSLFVIGDPDQAIYGFRGSMAHCFQQLEQDRPGLEIIRLVENYRSTPQIVGCALAAIAPNTGEARQLEARRPQGAKVRLVTAETELSEGIFVAKEINRMTGGMDMLDAQRYGAVQAERSFSDIAVLCRTHRGARLVEQCLRQESVPYVAVGRDDFFSFVETRGLVAQLRFWQRPADGASLGLALEKLWQCPADLVPGLQRLAGPDFGETAWREYGEVGCLGAFFAAERELSPRWAKEKPRKLLEELAAAAGVSEKPAVQKLCQMALFYKNVPAFLDGLLLGQEGDLLRAARQKYDAGAVRLMTLHGAKGLEFPVVFMCGVSQGNIPLESPDRPADLEEERRLFYVGMTRARDELILLAGRQPSAFLEGLPEAELLRQRAASRLPSQGKQLSLF